MTPETRYARAGDVHIAYQTHGHGPLDLILVPGFASNIDVFWDEPIVTRFFNELASFSRLVLFDKRGTGLSDRPTDTPTLEERLDDIRAVMDATLPIENRVQEFDLHRLHLLDFDTFLAEVRPLLATQ